jgi:hypothetical protein
MAAIDLAVREPTKPSTRSFAVLPRLHTNTVVGRIGPPAGNQMFSTHFLSHRSEVMYIRERFMPPTRRQEPIEREPTCPRSRKLLVRAPCSDASSGAAARAPRAPQHRVSEELDHLQGHLPLVFRPTSVGHT